MKTVPQIPHSDNPYELAMHAHNVRYYEQNIKEEAIHVATTAMCAEAVAVIGIMIVAVFVWAAIPGDYDQSSNRVSHQYSDSRAR